MPHDNTNANQFLFWVDDFDNLQELNANRDWSVQLVPSLAAAASVKGDCWLVLSIAAVPVCASRGETGGGDPDDRPTEVGLFKGGGVARQLLDAAEGDAAPPLGCDLPSCGDDGLVDC